LCNKQINALQLFKKSDPAFLLFINTISGTMNGKIKKRRFGCLKNICIRIILVEQHCEKSRLIYGRI